MVYLKHNLEKTREVVEAVSEQLAKPGTLFYTEEKKAELLAFLDTLV